MTDGMQSEHTEVAKGTFWGITGSMALKFVSFIYTIILARLFLQDDIGVFNLGLGLMYTVAMFADLGLNYAFSRYVPYYLGRGEKDKAKALLDLSYVYSGALTLVAALLLFALSGPIAEFYNMPALKDTLGMLSVFLVFNTLLTLNTAFLTGIKMLKESNFLTNAQNVLKLLLTIIAWWALGPNAFAIAFGFSISYMIAAAISFLWLRKGIAKRIGETKPIGKEETKKMLAETIPFGIMLTLVVSFWTLATNLDKLMLGYMLPTELATEAIAIYSFALSLATLIIIFPGAITSIFLPVLSEMHGGKKESHEVSLAASRWILFLIAPLTILLIVFPGELLAMFYGSVYAAGATALAILAVGMFLRSISYAHGTMLASLRIVKIEIVAGLIALIINAILNLVLIPTYGINGTAIASAVAFFAVTIFLVYYSKKLAGFGMEWDTLKPIIIAVLVLTLFWILRDPIVQIMAALPSPALGEGLILSLTQKVFKLAVLGAMFLLIGATYFAALSFSNCFRKEDRELLGSVLSKGRIPKKWVAVAQKFMGGQDV